MMFFVLLISIWIITPSFTQELPVNIEQRSLQEVSPDFTPQDYLSANSEQRMPLVLDWSWTRELREQGDEAIKNVRKLMGLRGKILEFEAWPAGADSIERVWVVARWRVRGTASWRWIELAPFSSELEKKLVIIPSIQKKEHLIFDDFMAPHRGLYDKPLFGDCLFTNREGSLSFKAWAKPDLRLSLRAQLTKDRAICRNFPRPPVLQGKPFVFHVESDGTSVQWKKTLPFFERKGQAIMGKPKFVPVQDNLLKDYRRDVQIIAGEKQAKDFGLTWPHFKRKNSAQKNNQIGDLVDYLEHRYKALGIITQRQVFFWRGIKQYNLIAKIPGTDPLSHPVVVADHMDTAFEEDTFERTGARVATHGADDNATAVAGLLAIAQTFHKLKPQRPIWLLHLTGEEFPADDLGARHFISAVLREKQKLYAVLIMDMIGYPGKDNHKRFFQISAGESPASLTLGQLSFKVASAQSQDLTPLLRSRFSPKTYLHQTDALIFSDLGFPVILFNEWLNQEDNWDRPYYHQHDDTSDTLDFEYAVDILKVVIQTIAQVSF